MKHKVFLDTSTLIAGSVFLTSKLIGVEIKDVFYDEATRLISIIKKHVNKRIGITTYAVEDEAYEVMSRAIERKLSQRIPERAKVFELLSVATNACESRLHEILSFILREPINPVECAKLYVQVVKMYNELQSEALTLPKPAAFMVAIAPRFLNKSELLDIYETQEEILNSQLTNLIYSPVEDSDKMILSQAVYLCRLYKGTETKTTMYLASTDQHFVPVRKWNYTSRQVTDTIEEKFDIIADKPHEIFLVLKKEYGE